MMTKRNKVFLILVVVLLLIMIWWHTPVRVFTNDEYEIIKLSVLQYGRVVEYGVYDKDISDILKLLNEVHGKRTLLDPFHGDIDQVKYQLILSKQGSRFPNLWISSDGSLAMLYEYPLDGLIKVQYRIDDCQKILQQLDERIDYD